jgi:hypothetical protein
MAYCIHDLDPLACGTCTPPASRSPVQELFGPWFDAGYGGECDGCGDDIASGDRIRADGEGGWLCSICGYTGRGTKFSERAEQREARETPAQAELRRRFEEGCT